jgi:hypothetical protein
MPDYFMTFANIKGFVETAARRKVLGVLTTVWDDGGSALFSRDWLGVAYAAEKSWNAGGEKDASFDSRFDHAVYRDESSSISKTIKTLTALTELGVTQEMNEEVFWSKVVPAFGERIKLDLSDWQAVVDICDSAAAFLSSAEPGRYRDELDVWNFTIEQYRYLAEERHTMLAAAGLYASACRKQRRSRSDAFSDLVHAVNLISRTRKSAVKMRNWYQERWLFENKFYSLAPMLDRYAEKERAFSDVEKRLLAAIENLDKGAYLPPPDEVRLAVAETKGQYFQSWLMVGPFPNPPDGGYDVDHLVALGGEQQARGKVAGQFKGLDGRTYRWQKVYSKKYAEIDLAELFKPNTRVLVYAYARIASPGPQSVKASFGSNDGIKVICNGELVFDKHLKRNLMIDEEECRLPLVKGTNHLLIKIDQGKGGWGFSFRLPENVVRNHKYKYTILE